MLTIITIQRRITIDLTGRKCREYVWLYGMTFGDWEKFDGIECAQDPFAPAERSEKADKRPDPIAGFLGTEVVDYPYKISIPLS